MQVGSFVAPIWGGAGGGSAMGSDEDRKRFVTQVSKASAIGKQMRDLGIRPTGGIRINSSVGVEAWDKDPKGNTKKIAETFREAAKAAQDYGEFLVAEGEICWGGMHSWREKVNLLELVGDAGRGRLPGRHGPLAALHPGLQCREGSAPARRITTGRTRRRSTPPITRSTDALRPWTLDFHVAQNDGTVFGSGDHDKTGPPLPGHRPQRQARHRQARRLSGCATTSGNLTKTIRHICWDGCMFPNAVMMKPETWNAMLGAMITVRDAHGWRE